MRKMSTQFTSIFGQRFFGPKSLIIKIPLLSDSFIRVLLRFTQQLDRKALKPPCGLQKFEDKPTSSEKERNKVSCFMIRKNCAKQQSSRGQFMHSRITVMCQYFAVTSSKYCFSSERSAKVLHSA